MSKRNLVSEAFPLKSWRGRKGPGHEAVSAAVCLLVSENEMSLPRTQYNVTVRSWAQTSFWGQRINDSTAQGVYADIRIKFSNVNADVVTFHHQKSHKLDTMFVQELLPNDFFVFWSERTYRKTKRLMYLALKKNGATKNALKTSSKHKSVHFMVMHCSRHRNQRATPNCWRNLQETAGVDWYQASLDS